MGIITLTLPVNGTTGDAGPIASDFTTLQTLLNGNIDNNNIAAGAAINVSKIAAPYAGYTPTWASTGVAPAIGNGTLQGRYVQIGKLVHFMMQWTAGTTTTFGTGSYSFTLPVTANTSFTGVPLGAVYANDSSGAVFQMAFPVLASSTTFNMQYVATWPTGTQALYAQTLPWTWAQSDTIWLTGTYEAA